MAESFAHNATVAKAKAMYGKRLTEDDYKELMNRQSVADAAEYLKRNTHYRDALSGIETAAIHRGRLEEILRRYSFERYANLCKFQGLDEREFYKYNIHKGEVEQILRCIRLINAKSSESFITDLPAYLMKHSEIDLIELARVRSFDDLLKVIEKSEYYSILKDLKPQKGELIDYPACERALRIGYLSHQMQVIERDFRGKTREDLKSLITTQIDLINIINAYRLKVFFHESAETIAPKMLPFYGRISKQGMYHLYEAADGEDFIKRLSKTSYGRQSAEAEGDFLEKRLTETRVKLTKLKLRFSQSAPVSLYTILYLFDIEIENIVTIIEGIRYKVPVSYMEKLIIPN